MTEEDIECILAIYRHQIEEHPMFILCILVQHYGLLCIDTKQAYVDALVEHYRRELKGEA